MNDKPAEQDRPVEPGPENLLTDFNLQPSWARQAPAPQAFRDDSSYDRPARRRDRDFQDRGDRGDRDFKRRDNRPPRRNDRDGFNRGGPRSGPRETGAPATSSAPAPAPAAGRPGRSEGFRPGPRSFEPRLPIEISFLPERVHLGAIVRRIHQSRRAYPLAEVAVLFLKQPEACGVKLEWSRERGAPEGSHFIQCKTCRAIFLRREAALEHAATAHAMDAFTEETVDVEPPTGNFVCVTRCPKSGKLLGPPNHHSFNETVAEWQQDHFPEIPLDQYRGSLETVHDAALIDQWKQEFTKRKQYRRKDQEGAEPVGVLKMRAMMMELAPAMLTETPRAIVPATLARSMEDPTLLRAVREAWTRESRFPMTLMFALRPALRHMGLHLFKAGGNISFVSAVEPRPLNPDHAVPPIRRVMEYLAAHPASTGDQMLAGLCEGKAPDSPDAREAMSHLHWLVDKGHVVEFYNGTLSVARSHRAAGRKSGSGPAAAEVQDVHVEAPPMDAVQAAAQAVEAAPPPDAREGEPAPVVDTP